MFRSVVTRLGSVVNGTVRSANVSPSLQTPWAVTAIRGSHGKEETADEMDARYVKYLSSETVDGWEIRKAMNDLQGTDVVPDPKIIIATLKACRRVNDYALAVRCLETVKDKCGPKVKEIWPYIVQEIRPTLDELGVLTPEEMGYDKPELALQNVYHIH